MRNFAKRPPIDFYTPWLILLFALVLFPLSITSSSRAQSPREVLLSAEAAYNPIPSSNGKMIAYVRTGWGREGGSGGMGRSNLVSEVMVMTDAGTPISGTPLTRTFLAGWNPDGSALVCYRDEEYALVSLSGSASLQGRIPHAPSVPTSVPWVFKSVAPTERVFYLPTVGSFGWSRPRAHFDTETSDTVIETKNGKIAQHLEWLGEDVVPSPNGRYLAVFDEDWEKDLWVYDMQSSEWFDLGLVTVYPDQEWSYMKATWNPWFSDSSHLVYVSSHDLVISSPDGGIKRKIPIDGQAGLPAPSPDGKSVAYLTFDPRPMKLRPDLNFWGGTIIWILPLAQGATPFAVTHKNSDTTLDLRWLDNSALVFDRFEDEGFPVHPRIWKVPIPSNSEK